MVGGVKWVVDFEAAIVEIPCPRCKFPNAVTLHESRFGLIFPCRGCKTRIRIVPIDAGVIKAKRLLEEFMDEFPKTINIKINF
jgi:hypothetical protein